MSIPVIPPYLFHNRLQPPVIAGSPLRTWKNTYLWALGEGVNSFHKYLDEYTSPAASLARICASVLLYIKLKYIFELVKLPERYIHPDTYEMNLSPHPKPRDAYSPRSSA